MLFRLSLFTAGVLVLLALFHLLIIGLPDSLTARITERLRQTGIPLHLDGITLSLRRGWVLHNARIYSDSPDRLEPVLQADKLYVQALPEQWTDLADTAWNLSVSGKQLNLAPVLEQSVLRPLLRNFQRINRIQVQMTVTRNRLSLTRCELQWDRLLFRASGQTALPLKSPPGSGETLKTFLNNHADRIAATAARLAFASPPEINLRFDIPADGFQQASARLTLFAHNLLISRQYIQQLSAACTVRPGCIAIDTFNLTDGSGKSLSAFGRRETSDGQTSLSLSSTLPAETLLALLPGSVTNSLARTGIEPFGKTEFDLLAGPAPLRNLPEHINLHVHAMQLRRNGLTLSPLRFDLAASGPQLTVSDLTGEADGGPLSASGSFNIDSGAWQVSAEGSVPNAPIGELLGGTSQKWIDRFSFTNRFPHIALQMSKGAETNTFHMQADVSARDFLCTGLPFQTLETTLIYSNRIFRLDPLRAAQGDRSLDAAIALDFDKDLAFFNASGSFAPPLIAQIIAPDDPTILTNFTFSGPVACEASGRIDYSGGTDHAASGTIRAEAVSARGLTATQFKSRVEARGDRLIFSGGTAALLGGTAEGSGVFDLRFNDQTAPFRLDIDLTRLNLGEVIRQLGTSGTDQAQGRLSATLNLSANASQDFWESASGYGEVEIEEGRLRDLPVFGGFSRLIRTTLPGFSLFSLTTLYADYEFYDGRLHSDNVELGGTLLSAKARGTWSHNSGLDFVVQAQPLRQTRETKPWYMVHLWFADLLRESTAPLFRLLEFELRGPLDNPRWRLLNLPKEISEIMQPSENEPAPAKDAL